MDTDKGASEPITVDLQLDETLKQAAAWYGLPVDAYVRLAVTTMAKADAELAEFARDSLAPTSNPVAGQGELDAWFAAERERRNGT